MIYLHTNQKRYTFDEPQVIEYNVEGIQVLFCDGRSIFCDSVEGGDTTIWWGADKYAEMVGPKEKVYSKEDYIDYCKKKWLHSVENKMEAAQRTLEKYKGLSHD